MLSGFIKKNNLPEKFKHTVEQHYIPLAEQVYDNYLTKNACYFVGVNGCQGSGKSTFSAFVAEYLAKLYHVKTVVMSLDDFYFSQEQRNALAKHIHPLLETRGVPGTHNIDLLSSVLTSLKAGKTNIAIPKFNKAADNPFPHSKWQHLAHPADIVILEGWCWGVNAQTNDELSIAVNELEQHQDSNGKWRAYVNEQLGTRYQPLYQQMDYWIAIQAPSFESVYRWRLEQEQKLKNALTNEGVNQVMDETQVLDFIQYFQRLTEHGLKTLPDYADTTLMLDESRKIVRTHLGNK